MDKRGLLVNGKASNRESKHDGRLRGDSGSADYSESEVSVESDVEGTSPVSELNIEDLGQIRTKYGTSNDTPPPRPQTATTGPGLVILRRSVYTSSPNDGAHIHHVLSTPHSHPRPELPSLPHSHPHGQSCSRSVPPSVSIPLST